METILITGATGLLGSSLAPYLRQCGYKVVTHAHKTQADVMFDLSDRVKSYDVIEQIQPSIIINLVGLTSVDLCETNVDLAYLVNTRTVENIVFWIESSKANCHLIQISTDQIYDGAGPHTEDKITITNNYAFSKYAAELAALRVASTICRTNFVGRSKAGHRESLTDWVYNSTKGNKLVQVLSDVYFSPLSIMALVDILKMLVEMKPVGIYNLGSHHGMSKADFDFAFAECLKLSTKTMERIETNQALFLKAYRPKDMRMDISKFENAVGIKLPNLSDLIKQISMEYDQAT